MNWLLRLLSIPGTLLRFIIAAYFGTQYGRYRAAQDCYATSHFAGGGMAFSCQEDKP